MCRGTEALVRYGPDETKYETDGPTLKALRADGSAFRAADGIWPRDFVVGHNGLIYATEPGAGSASSSVWLIRPGGRKELVDTGLLSATGITLSPDQSLLYVADGASHWVYSYQVQADGTLANKQRYYWLHSLDTEDASHAAALCCDRAGWLYVATDLGIQVCDQAGRVNAILPLPGGRPAKAVAFAGPKFDTLFVISGSVTYRRCLNAVAANPWAEPVLPPAPHL
jgi:sugar lactone lactonase YvrE